MAMGSSWVLGTVGAARASRYCMISGDPPRSKELMAASAAKAGSTPRIEEVRILREMDSVSAFLANGTSRGELPLAPVRLRRSSSRVTVGNLSGMMYSFVGIREGTRLDALAATHGRLIGMLSGPTSPYRGSGRA